MKVVMTLLARDEADIVDAQLAFHLDAGVDFVIATDNRSQDGTTEILQSHARAGHLHLIHETEGGLRQGKWVTRMARLAAAQFGADWVINSDADEFWWPRDGSLRELLADVPPTYGIVGAVVRQFVARPDNEAFFAERLTLRLSQLAPINDPASPFRPKVKIVHRADRHAAVLNGNHALAQTALVAVPGWYPFEMFHFGTRSFPQFERKVVTMRQELGVEARGHYARAFDAYEASELKPFYDAMVVNDDERDRGLANGTLAEDARLRDAFRRLHGSTGGESTGETVADEASRAVEVAVLAEAEVIRLQRSLDELERRVGALELARRPTGRDLSSAP